MTDDSIFDGLRDFKGDFREMPLSIYKFILYHDSRIHLIHGIMNNGSKAT